MCAISLEKVMFKQLAGSLMHKSKNRKNRGRRTLTWVHFFSGYG